VGEFSLAVRQLLPVEARAMQTIACHLESLKDIHDGDELRGLILRVLRRYAHAQTPDGACLAELHQQLQRYADDPVVLPNMRIRARLLQQHIAPYLPEPDDAPLGGADHAPAPAATPITATPIDGTAPRAAERVTAARYRMLLRSEQDAWRAIYGTVDDYQKLKQAWTKSLNELAQQREALEHKLVQTTEQLTLLQAQHDRLQAELDKARRETTPPRAAVSLRLLPCHSAGALPKRDVFVRVLETEIKRIKRSGAPLALGLIGVEQLDVITEQHGAAAGDATLRCYAEEIFASFRAYDLVALYQPDQFAVMFPDTRQDGARRALEKAYKRAAATYVTHADATFPLPPFAGALTSYAAGEDPGALLGRAQQALEHALRDGNTGVVLA
jgi:diguanylate cyclase